MTLQRLLFCHHRCNSHADGRATENIKIAGFPFHLNHWCCAR